MWCLLWPLERSHTSYSLLYRFYDQYMKSGSPRISDFRNRVSPEPLVSCAQAPPAKGHDGLWGREWWDPRQIFWMANWKHAISFVPFHPLKFFQSQSLAIIVIARCFLVKRFVKSLLFDVTVVAEKAKDQMNNKPRQSVKCKCDSQKFYIFFLFFLLLLFHIFKTFSKQKLYTLCYIHVYACTHIKLHINLAFPHINYILHLSLVSLLRTYLISFLYKNTFDLLLIYTCHFAWNFLSVLFFEAMYFSVRNFRSKT